MVFAAMGLCPVGDGFSSNKVPMQNSGIIRPEPFKKDAV
jgi:hypothetical protein